MNDFTGLRSDEFEKVLDDRKQRVIEAIEEAGGCVKQPELYPEMDLGEQQIQQAVKLLEKDGRIRKLRIGRTNVLYLKGEVPESAKPPSETGYYE